MHHMVHDESKLIAPTEKQGFIDTAGQERLQVQAIGDATLQVGNVKIPLTDVLYIPSLSKNLLSVPALTKDGAQVIFEESGAIILQHDGSMVKSKTNQHKKRWEVHGDSLVAQLNDPLKGIDISTTPARPASHTTSKLWHKQFGHSGRNKTKQIQAHYLGRETQLEHDARDCDCCSQAKQTCARMISSKTERAQAPLELVHIDLMTDLQGHPNYHHALVVVDNASSYVYVKPLLSKAEAFPALKAWIKTAEITTDCTLKCICSDNGTEWSSFVSWAGMLGKQEGTSREHGRSAVSMETMDSYGFTCKGGAGPYARRGRQEEDQAQGACRWLPFRGSRDKSQRNHHRSKEEEQCIGDRQVGPEEEEQCRRSRHCSGGTGVPSKEEEQCRRSRHSSGGQEWC
ncbi:uncharacterized protein UDID_17506 [Ustilago sp. UG-2017a]|nr:uncharacterized protein UDID_17506 [Ustilago sp. UG-2017a]